MHIKAYKGHSILAAFDVKLAGCSYYMLEVQARLLLLTARQLMPRKQLSLRLIVQP
jgi:hypothetical protein